MLANLVAYHERLAHRKIYIHSKNLKAKPELDQDSVLMLKIKWLFSSIYPEISLCVGCMHSLHAEKSMINFFFGGGAGTPSRPPPPMNNFCLYPPPIS